MQLSIPASDFRIERVTVLNALIIAEASISWIYRNNGCNLVEIWLAHITEE